MELLPAPAAPPPDPPEGLGPRAARLWGDILDEQDLRTDELRVLEDACREVDLIERMHVELQGAPLVVKGSMGQDVANPLVQELRQHRALVARLLGSLKLSDEDREGYDAQARSAQARKAALTRHHGSA
ncbi:hypothetical protein OG723_12290 [Streptomyces sp. NBC_01278]|uniref:hypothetical protein n=1 Tax=unclassified Streptomyces TaxID=2593676 RepID=UPI002E12B357|nr:MULTISPECIES: hypothetical protein [unclassified Streptomyces]WSR24843.1 hypothetical protein OG573_01035 [Streptomyces sp. NBC_01205]